MQPSWTWRWPQFDAVLRVDPDAGATFQRARQRWFQYERGGQLFADLSRPDGVWLTASPPHQDDAAGFTWLELDVARCRAEIERANQAGQRLIGYWHTHPQHVPQLSPKDCASFREFVLRNQGLPHPIAVIVGTSTTGDGIKAWSMQGDGAIEGVIQL